MNNLVDFFHMGGYALYVWSAYGLATVVLGYNIVVPLFQLRGLQRRLALREADSNRGTPP